MVFIDEIVQSFFRQLLVVGSSKIDFEIVDGIGLDPAKVLFLPAGLEQHAGDEIEIFPEVVFVGAPHESRHFLVDLRRKPRSHRIHGLDDLGIRQLPGPSPGDHRRSQCGHALFALRIRGASDLEKNSKRNQRRGTREKYCFHLGALLSIRKRQSRSNPGKEDYQFSKKTSAFHRYFSLAGLRVTTVRPSGIKYFFAICRTSSTVTAS